MDFHTAEELLELCSQGTDIATVMREREVTQGETDSETIEEKMKKPPARIRRLESSNIRNGAIVS